MLDDLTYLRAVEKKHLARIAELVAEVERLRETCPWDCDWCNTEDEDA